MMACKIKQTNAKEMHAGKYFQELMAINQHGKIQSSFPENAIQHIAGAQKPQKNGEDTQIY